MLTHHSLPSCIRKMEAAAAAAAAAAAGKGVSGNNNHLLQVAAPFVMKTYEMVNEPNTDFLIRWGRENNSFLVLDPSYFSQLLLPSYFKHSNFSSFVRQLNTYGFRKVDPDNWEFAHEAFLRGQIHLLPLIVRRKKRAEDFLLPNRQEEEGGDEEMLLIDEVRRLREEQKSLDEELDSLSKRLQVTERRPHQMMSFLFKVAEDPDFLPRFILSKKEQQLMKKKKRRVNWASTSLPPLPQSLEESEIDDDQVAALSGEETGFACNSENSYINDAASATQWNNFPAFDTAVTIDHIGSASSDFLGGAQETTTTVAYPFSLLGGNVFF